MPTLEDLRKEKIGEKHKLLDIKLTYDQFQYRLESFYFWLVDFLRDGLKLNVEKVSDVFGASVGSFFFGEMGQRLAALISQGRALGEVINTVAKSIISILNEYRLLETRIKLCDDIKSKNSEEALAAFKAIKSIWLDNVDVQKGGASLRNLAARVGYATIMDLFMMYELGAKIDSLVQKGIISKELGEELKKRDIKSVEERKIFNQRVINIVKQRLEEFYNWLELYEKELRSRRDILKAYLKHQINAFVTYTEFAKPYFRFARRLLMKEYNVPDITSVFETAIIELVLLATGEEKEIAEWDEKEEKSIKKKYVPLYEISIKFRAMPTMVTRTSSTTMYTFLGRTDFEFRTYLVTKEELDDLKASEEVQDLLYIQGMTDDFLKSIAEAIFNIFIWDEIQKDPKLKEEIAKRLNKKPEEIKRPEDIKWSRDLVDLIKEKKPNLLQGIEWIKKYLPEEKKEEKKEEKEEEEKEKGGLFLFMPFLDLFASTLERAILFILAFPRKIGELEKSAKKKIVEERKEEEMKKLKEDTLDLGWKIYEIFKKSFGLLSW